MNRVLLGRRQHWSECKFEEATSGVSNKGMAVCTMPVAIWSTNVTVETTNDARGFAPTDPKPAMLASVPGAMHGK